MIDPPALHGGTYMALPNRLRARREAKARESSRLPAGTIADLQHEFGERGPPCSYLVCIGTRLDWQ